MSDKISININGMRCDGCSSRVRVALENIDGVLSATVDHNAKKAEIEIDNNNLTADLFVETVKKLGYNATV